MGVETQPHVTGIRGNDAGSLPLTAKRSGGVGPTPVEGRFALLRDGHGFAFRLGQYDKSQPLIIDPSLSFSTYLGGSAVDIGQSIAVDSSGNVYVTGYTYSSDFPTVSAYDTTLGGTIDAFVTKFNAAGSALTFSTYLGGSSDDVGKAIAVDSSGSVYVTGYTYSSDFPTASAYDTTLGGTIDAFVTKFNATGSALTFSTYLGGSSNDYGYGIAVDSSGNVYVTGYTESSDFPTASAYDTTLGGTQDAFITKFNSSGSTLTFSTYLGGASNDYGYGIAIDSSGNIYMTGYTYSSDFPTINAYDTTCGGCTGNPDVFVTKFNSSGSALTFSTYLGGSSSEQGNSIAVDSAGNIYVTGWTSSSDFPTVSAYDSTLGGTQDAFITKFNSSGSALTFSTYLGGSGNNDQGNSIAVDSSSNVYVTGYTLSSDFPTASAYDSTMGGSQDAFVTKFNSAGSALTFSTYLGGSASDSASGIAVDSSGNVYVTGYTLSSDFPTASAYDSTLGGTQDAFVTKFDMSDPSTPTPSIAFTKVLSPYWQTDNWILTFIAVSHPSLSGMAGQIGVHVDAVYGVDGSVAGSAEFTVGSVSTGTLATDAKRTHRLYIVATNASHSIQSNTPTSTNTDNFITTATSSPRFGSVVITPVASHPGICAVKTTVYCGFREITSLNFWGAVLIVNTLTGFAMEFIGDAHDSAVTGATNNVATASGLN
jgi:hypothetical protein